eukprot:TRINITY_DN7815_c0_g2_i2.p2 TRINITY_DN7815_c0_g2~~TRINITY_DN7815_c0_g2_i2.p2  ORF type:complete len:142 (-),score=11.34 TRINITY_DN7815_c0_g2_i2:413-838(-)
MNDVLHMNHIGINKGTKQNKQPKILSFESCSLVNLLSRKFTIYIDALTYWEAAQIKTGKTNAAIVRIGTSMTCGKQGSQQQIEHVVKKLMMLAIAKMFFCSPRRCFNAILNALPSLIAFKDSRSGGIQENSAQTNSFMTKM